MHEKTEQGNGDTWNKDTLHAEGPSPTSAVQECRRDWTSQPCCNDTRRAAKRLDKASMSKRGSISDKDAKTVANPIDADSVKDLRRSVRFNIVAGSRHDKSKSCKSSAEQEALRSAEDVESLCDTQIGDTSNDRAQNAGSRRERVHCKGGCNIWDQSAADTRDKTLDEVDEPDEDEGDHQRGSGPREGDGLDVLYTMLEVGVYHVIDGTF